MRLRTFYFVLVASLLTAAAAPAQTLPSVTLEGFRNVHINGNDTTYMQSLTHRYVGSDLRFLTLTHKGVLMEFSIAGRALDSTVSATTATWNLSPTGALNDFNGIWFEQAKNRLWVTSSKDYTDVNYPAKVTLISLGTGGSVSVIKTFTLNVPAKRVYGGCNAVPATLRTQLGGAYVCGWGGYTSLVRQGGGASIGPAMYAIQDPDTIAAGSTVPVRAVLDTYDSRGLRTTIPVNYFDGGDPRANPPTRPSSPPLSSGGWLSPNAQGLGWMTWGDSYYNTGVWIGTTYAAVMSGCKGSCWYQSSTLAFDGRQFELHLWDGTRLGSNLLQRPDRMTELLLPRGNTQVWSGDIPTGNIAGATYDATTNRLYMIGYPLGPSVYTGRLYSLTVGGSTTPPPPAAVNCVGGWSQATTTASACVSGTRTLTHRRTFSISTPAANGGSACEAAHGATSEVTTTDTCESTPGPTPDPPTCTSNCTPIPGPAGPTGPAGPLGPQGVPGVPGRDGTNGRDAVLPGGFVRVLLESAPAPTGYTKLGTFLGRSVYVKD